LILSERWKKKVLEKLSTKILKTISKEEFLRVSLDRRKPTWFFSP